MTAHPKPPARRREPVKVYANGREACNLKTAEGEREYSRRRLSMTERQQGYCAICGEWMFFQIFDHEKSRGGGKRDDRIIVDGRWQNAAVHFECNSIKGSKCYHWKDGKYVPRN